MYTLIQIIDWVLFIILGLSICYLLIFALAARIRRPRNYSKAESNLKFCILFPAYKEDLVIVQAVRTFLNQSYNKQCYKIIVISDQMQDITNEKLRQLPIRLLIADYQDSSKAKALKLAATTKELQESDITIIMDADNIVHPNFLEEMNQSFYAGEIAVQAHRTAKNLNTDIALLDAVSEEINNTIFRSGHIALGLSSALIGSGMGIQTRIFLNFVYRLNTAGEDKELEALLLKERYHISYLENTYVEDEKTQKKENIKRQRKRWFAAQLDSLFSTLPDLPSALLKGNIDYADKIIQWMLPPRIILLTGVFIISFITSIIQFEMSVKWWTLLILLIGTLIMAIPNRLWNYQLLKALFQIPGLAIMMLVNLFKLKGVNKKFIHTEHNSH